MITNPFGMIIVKCCSLDNQAEVAELTPDKLSQSGGHRYSNARKPELYRNIIRQAHHGEQKVAWLKPSIDYQQTLRK